MKTVLHKIRGEDNCLGWGNVAYMPGRLLMADDCLVRSGAIFEGRHLTNCHCGSGSHAHHTQLACHHVDRQVLLCILDHPAHDQGRSHHWSGACSSIGLSGVWGGWPPLKMLPMSVNPSGGAHGLTMMSSVEVSTLWLEVARGLELQVIIGEPGAESLVLLHFWTCSAQSCALLWLWQLQLWWQCCSSPRLWGASPTGTATLEGWICVQTRVTRAISFSISLAPTTSSTSTPSIRSVGSVVACGGSTALSSDPGRLVRWLVSGCCLLEVFSQGSGQHKGLGDLANTRPWSSSTVGHWKRPPRVGSNSVADFGATCNGVIAKDLRILEGCQWLHSLS